MFDIHQFMKEARDAEVWFSISHDLSQIVSIGGPIDATEETKDYWADQFKAHEREIIAWVVNMGIRPEKIPPPKGLH